MPRVTEEDRLFRDRLAAVLREVRAAAGLTQEDAAEEIGVQAAKLGRWERGDFAPKGYDLGRIWRGYAKFGLDWQWLFDPPQIVVVNPVRERLREIERSATSAADAREAQAAERRQRGGAGQGAEPGRRRTRKPPRSFRLPSDQ